MSTSLNFAIGWGLNTSNLDLTTYFDRCHDEELFQTCINLAHKDATAANIRSDINNSRMEAIIDSNVFDFCDCTFSEKQHGLKDKLLLIPPTHTRQFTRVDNDIDLAFYEATVNPISPNWMSPTWIEKPGCISPFIGLMKPNLLEPKGIEFYWEYCFLSNPDAELKIPKAPLILWYIIDHLDFAPNRTTDIFLSLRPTVCRWWHY